MIIAACAASAKRAQELPETFSVSTLAIACQQQKVEVLFC